MTAKVKFRQVAQYINSLLGVDPVPLDPLATIRLFKCQGTNISELLNLFFPFSGEMEELFFEDKQSDDNR